MTSCHFNQIISVQFQTIFSTVKFSLFHLSVIMSISIISISILGGHASPLKQFSPISIDISIMYTRKGGKQWISTFFCWRLSRYKKRRREDMTERRRAKAFADDKRPQLIWSWAASSSGASRKMQTGAVNKAEALSQLERTTVICAPWINTFPCVRLQIIDLSWTSVDHVVA